MSSGRVCICPKDKDHGERKNWVVTQYRCNHSAFNGYHQTLSDYSSVICKRCGAAWRTRAGYVDELPKEATA
jgi:hypothetical protein